MSRKRGPTATKSLKEQAVGLRYFPARYDDVVLAAAVCVKELETLVGKRPTEPRFRVFAQSSSEDGFQGFAPESLPPALEALAS